MFLGAFPEKGRRDQKGYNICIVTLAEKHQMIRIFADLGVSQRRGGGEGRAGWGQRRRDGVGSPWGQRGGGHLGTSGAGAGGRMDERGADRGVGQVNWEGHVSCYVGRGSF